MSLSVLYHHDCAVTDPDFQIGGGGGWASSRPGDKGGRSFSFSLNPSFSLVPRSPTFQCKTE